MRPVTTEEQIGYWSACYKALTTHYGFDRAKATYFATHVEADLEEHEDGVMGHASFNRMALQRLLETGMAEERPTYGLEYCAMTSVDCTARCCVRRWKKRREQEINHKERKADTESSFGFGNLTEKSAKNAKRKKF
jgi:hypothetical protein